MKINKLSIRNFRCFEDLVVDFSPDHNLHVIIAPNMVGKSALIKAVRIAASSYLRKIIRGGARNISNVDHRVIGNNPFTDIARECSISTAAEVLNWNGRTWETSTFEWRIYRENTINTKTKYESLTSNDLDNAVIRTYDRVIEKNEKYLPLLLYVGTEYIHQPHAQTDTLDLDGSAQQGYWYCFEEKSMENYVFDWLKIMNDTLDEQKEKSNADILYGDLPKLFLECFEEIIKKIFPDEIIGVQFLKKRVTSQTRPREANKEREIKVKNESIITFRFANDEVRTYEMLSDGYRYLVLLAGEIITRSLLLNKHLSTEVADITNGIVLIDEFGIHLHPELQMSALQRLKAAFPNIQFIISTHSPLLLNGLKKEQVHILEVDGNSQRIIRNASQDVIGLGAEGILKDIFGMTSTLDDISRKWAQDYRELFLKKTSMGLTEIESDEFKQLGENLSEISLSPEIDSVDIQDPLYQRFKMYINREKTLKGKNPSEITEDEMEKIIKEIIKG
ncbi:AAA family ATPase [Chitinophaga pendula]|uniref:AAA family ATPase n=1 Tax=Chitinophaga TaxID=79328 RepID=UPI000BAEE01E|nr:MULTISPECIES: AAA family ATPase [Chitinophaga]ASZ14053.1 hypothetical protein CK934_25435 [Chitinophaga sp. MD30]UCJ08316.1 AAA family ATPase [Chitinophaga pendula]